MVPTATLPSARSFKQSILNARQTANVRMANGWAVLAMTSRSYVYKTSSFLSHLACLGLLTLIGYDALIVNRSGETKTLPLQPIEGLATRTVVTERIIKTPGRQPVAPTTAIIPPSETEDAAVPPPTAPPKTAIEAVPNALPPVWTEADIASAAAICKMSLASLSIRSIPKPPMRVGLCGNAAPIEMGAVGEPSVSLHPPVTTNCRVASAVDVWVTTVLQPAAKELLGSSVVKLTGTSSYVCRNRNGASLAPISEHAFANAFDVTSFQLADGRSIDVAVWGATVPKSQPAAANGAVKEKTVVAAATSAPVGQPVSTAPEDVRIKFLKRIHHEACPLFGTVLGPDANEAHREHLHFDMKDRRGKMYCQ